MPSGAKAGKSKTETYEDEAKRLFTAEPARMKLLIVVDKLLTGFDAPSCTYLYIDKSMQDHGLFQAICRTNRLDGEDKDFGYIVDYKDLFKKVEDAIAVYSEELDHTADGPDPELLLQERLKKGRERLDEAIEQLALLCEPVEAPKGELEHIHYFCGNTEIASDPAFFEKMSQLLDEIIAERKRKALAYAKYLQKIAALVAKVQAGHEDDIPGKQQEKLRGQDRETPRDYIERESHYLWGKRYLLTIVEDEPPKVERTHRQLILQVRPGATLDKREELLAGWYRDQLRQAVSPLIARWAPMLGVKVEKFFIQHMKTKWGGCSPGRRTIRLNTELAKKPPECLAYLVVHEMVHLLEPTHNERFVSFMDRLMPNWRRRRDLLNSLPVRHENWRY